MTTIAAPARRFGAKLRWRLGARRCWASEMRAGPSICSPNPRSTEDYVAERPPKYAGPELPAEIAEPRCRGHAANPARPPEVR